MTQLAYLTDNKNTSHEGLTPEMRGRVSLFGENLDALRVLAEDVKFAGFSVAGTRALSSVLDTANATMGDVVLVECAIASAANLAALAWIDERVAKSGAALIVSTQQEALEDVFGCVDQSRGQILVSASRAERLVALASALSLIPGSEVREMDEGERAALARLTDEVTRLARKLDGLPTDERSDLIEATPLRVASPTQGFRYLEREEDMARKPRTPLPDPRLVKSVIRERQRRVEFFDGDLFADPAWDILLDLTAARAEHRRVSVTSLCIAANVPPTTALRWITQMVDAGILERVQDDTDRRRAFIVLSDSAADAMARYFNSLGTDEIGPI